jgi:hypothetical protein
MNKLEDFFSLVKDIISPSSNNTLAFLTKKRFDLLGEVNDLVFDNDKKLQNLIQAVKTRKIKKVYFYLFLLFIFLGRLRVYFRAVRTY